MIASSKPGTVQLASAMPQESETLYKLEILHWIQGKYAESGGAFLLQYATSGQEQKSNWNVRPCGNSFKYHAAITFRIDSEVELTPVGNEGSNTILTAQDGQAEGKSKAERVYHHLRRLIREVKLSPGTHIQKEQVAAELGVSVAPVSHALARLAEDMLVEIRPRHGSFVAPLRAHDLRECMFLRRALEVEAIRMVAAAGGEELKQNLELNFEQQLSALETNNLFLLYDLDAEFHSILMRATGFPRVINITVAARVAVDRPRQFARVMNERAEGTVREHRRIIDAIALGDPEYAAAAMLSHLNLATDSLEAALAQIELDGVITL